MGKRNPFPSFSIHYPPQKEEAKTKEQVCRIVNRERKKWKRMNEGIGIKEWEEYFKEIGIDGKVI